MLYDHIGGVDLLFLIVCLGFGLRGHVMGLSTSGGYSYAPFEGSRGICRNAGSGRSGAGA